MVKSDWDWRLRSSYDFLVWVSDQGWWRLEISSLVTALSRPITQQTSQLSRIQDALFKDKLQLLEHWDCSCCSVGLEIITGLSSLTPAASWIHWTRTACIRFTSWLTLLLITGLLTLWPQCVLAPWHLGAEAKKFKEVHNNIEMNCLARAWVWDLLSQLSNWNENDLLLFKLNPADNFIFFLIFYSDRI